MELIFPYRIQFWKSLNGLNLDNIKSFYLLMILQYLKEAGWADGGRVIACTQPRRLAVQVFYQSSPTSSNASFCKLKFLVSVCFFGPFCLPILSPVVQGLLCQSSLVLWNVDIHLETSWAFYSFAIFFIFSILIFYYKKNFSNPMKKECKKWMFVNYGICKV